MKLLSPGRIFAVTCLSLIVLLASGAGERAASVTAAVLPAAAELGLQAPALVPSAVAARPAAIRHASAPRPAPLFETLCLPITRNVDVRDWSQAAGSVLRTPDRTSGTEALHDIYVEEIAYGLDGETLALAYLRGIYDDGRPVVVDHRDHVVAVSGPAELAGARVPWSCGGNDGTLLLDEVRYAVAGDGYLELQALHGVLESGAEVHFERQAGLRADCDPMSVTECLPNPTCWGWCSNIFSCGCNFGGSGDACNLNTRIKCVNNSCYAPRTCVYNQSTGFCDCVHAGLACQTYNNTTLLSPHSVACSNDGGFTVTENGHARMYFVDHPTQVLEVHYGVEICRDVTGQGFPCNVYLRVWHAPNFPDMAGAVMLDNVQDLVPDGTQLQLRSVQMNGQQVPPGPCVVEIWNENGDTYFGFFPGSNPDGQTGPSFIRAPSCSVPQWMNLADIGLPNVHLVLCMSMRTLPGDMDCSGQLDFGDINPFVLALSNPAAYAENFPNCFISNGDIDGNGQTGFSDINLFVGLLSGT